MKDNQGHYQESEYIPFTFNPRPSYEQMRYGRRTGLYFGSCDPNKIRFGFFPDWQDYIDYDSVPLEAQWEETSDSVIKRVPEVDFFDELLGKTPQKSMYSQPSLISVQKYQNTLNNQQPHKLDEQAYQRKDQKIQKDRSVYTEIKEQGMKTQKRTGELYEQKIIKFKEQMEQISCAKDIMRKSVQSYSLQMSRTANDIDETRTDFLRYLQKEEQSMVIEDKVDHKEKEKKNKSKKSVAKPKVQELKVQQNKKAPAKSRRVSIMDKGRIKWPGDSTTPSLNYILPVQLTAFSKDKSQSITPSSSQQNMLEVIVQYEPIQPSFNPWEEETLTMRKQEKPQPIKKKKSKSKKSKKSQDQLQNTTINHIKKDRQKPTKPRKNRSKSSKATSNSSRSII